MEAELAVDALAQRRDDLRIGVQALAVRENHRDLGTGRFQVLALGHLNGEGLRAQQDDECRHPQGVAQVAPKSQVLAPATIRAGHVPLRWGGVSRADHEGVSKVSSPSIQRPLRPTSGLRVTHRL